MSRSHLKGRLRSDYPYMKEYRTRWADNDMYQHMNNTIYNVLYDAIISAFLIENCDLRPSSSPQYGMFVKTATNHYESISFPAVAELCLGVISLGNSSVTYEIALFERGVEEVKAVGEFVQVFVDRQTGRPNDGGMDGAFRRGLERILMRRPSKL